MKRHKKQKAKSLIRAKHPFQQLQKTTGSQYTVEQTTSVHNFLVYMPVCLSVPFSILLNHVSSILAFLVNHNSHFPSCLCYFLHMFLSVSFLSFYLFYICRSFIHSITFLQFRISVFFKCLSIHVDYSLFLDTLFRSFFLSRLPFFLLHTF